MALRQRYGGETIYRLHNLVCPSTGGRRHCSDRPHRARPPDGRTYWTVIFTVGSMLPPDCGTFVT